MAAKKESPDDLVTVTRKDSKKEAVVTRRAFERVWKDRGYTLVTAGSGTVKKED